MKLFFLILALVWVAVMVWGIVAHVRYQHRESRQWKRELRAIEEKNRRRRA